MEKDMKFVVFIDKYFNVKEIWMDNRKVQYIKNISIFCGIEGTHIKFEISPRSIEFKFWEDEYGE